MAITNKNLIKQLEKEYKIELVFSYIDNYGLYCEIHYKGVQGTGVKDFENINVYDSGVCWQRYIRTKMLREFLTDVIYQYLD